MGLIPLRSAAYLRTQSHCAPASRSCLQGDKYVNSPPQLPGQARLLAKSHHQVALRQMKHLPLIPYPAAIVAMCNVFSTSPPSPPPSLPQTHKPVQVCLPLYLVSSCMAVAKASGQRLPISFLPPFFCFPQGPPHPAQRITSHDANDITRLVQLCEHLGLGCWIQLPHLPRPFPLLPSVRFGAVCLILA